MLDPGLCEREPIPWLSVKSDLSQWLQTPVQVIPMLALFILLPLLLLKGKARKRLTLLNSLPLVIYVLALLPPVVSLAEWGLTTWLPQDSGKPADAIVLLGRGRQLNPSRVQDSFELWQADRAPLIFASGFGDAPIMADQLLQRGVPALSVQSEACSQTTEENAQFTAAILHPQGVERIILITDPVHMTRSWLTFRSLGFEVIPYVSTRPPAESTLSIYREYLGLASYGLLGRFWSRPITALASPDSNDYEQVDDQLDSKTSLKPFQVFAFDLLNLSVESNAW